MNKSHYNIVYLILSQMFICSMFAYAQQSIKKDTINNEEISVIKAYNPIIKTSKAISLPISVPSLPLEPRKKMEFETEVKPIDVHHEKLSLKALTYTTPRDKKTKPAENEYNGFIQAGFGNYTSPLLRAAYITSINKIEIGANFAFLSSKNNDKIYASKFSRTNFETFAKILNEKLGFYIRPEIKFGLHSNMFYGHSLKLDSIEFPFTNDSLKQRFTAIHFNTEIKNFKVNKNEIDYSIKPFIQFYNDRFKTKESIIQLYAEARKKISTHFIKADITIGNQSTKDIQNKRNNFLLRTTPAFEFNKQGWQLDLGLNLTLDEKEFLIYPFLGTSKSLFGNKLVFYNGWKILKQQNSYQNFTSENPFIHPLIITNKGLQNTRFEDRYMGVRGFFNKFDYNVRFAQKLIKKLPLYVNDTLYGKTFNVIYDDATIMHLHAQFQYETADYFTIYSKFDFNGYKMENEAKAWHRPTLRFNIGGNFKPIQTLILNAEIYAQNQIFAKDNNGVPSKISGNIDVNIGAQYAFLSNISAYIHLNNLLSKKYYLYQNYPVLGLNGTVGIIWKF